MKNQIGRAGIFFGIVVIALIGGLVWYSAAASNYQTDADVIRLNDLAHIGQLIERYHARTGHYPFQGAHDVPTYVHIASENQRRQIVGGPPYAHEVVDEEELRNELETVLGQRVEFPHDPQRVAVGRPNFYMYMINGDTYHLAVHLHHRYSFAQHVGPNYSKLELSNKPNPASGIWSIEELLDHKQFLTSATRPLHKPQAFARSNFRDAIETAHN